MYRINGRIVFHLEPAEIQRLIANSGPTLFLEIGGSIANSGTTLFLDIGGPIANSGTTLFLDIGIVGYR